MCQAHFLGVRNRLFRACFRILGDRFGRTKRTRKEQEKDSPVSIPSTRSTCEPHDASADVGPEPRRTLARALSSKRETSASERRSQCEQSAPSRADLVCFAPRQTTQRLCIPTCDVTRAGRNTRPKLLLAFITPFVSFVLRL